VWLLCVLLGAEASAATYYRSNESVPVVACTEAPTQHDHLITLAGNRRLLVSTWMPPSLYQGNTTRVLELARWADRSLCTTTPLSVDCVGLMSSGYNTSPQHQSWGWTDLVVVTSKLLLWFDMTAGHPLNASYATPPNGGGGQLRGVWALGVDGSGRLNFRDIRNSANWAPNMFLPGATGSTSVQGSGISGFITQFSADNGVTYNLENDTNAYLAIHGPTATVEGGSGTLHAQGFLVQSIGSFVDTRADNDRYLVGATGTSGRVRAWTTHRFAACDDQVFLENLWRNEANNRVGPVVNILVATNAYGEPNPVVRGGNLLELGNTSPETCVVRRRWADDGGCHAGLVDFMWYAGHEQEYRARASLTVPPPTMTLWGRNGSGGATAWRMGLHPLSGIITQGTIFDLHSMCPAGACKLIPAFDATLFNNEFWDSADPRAKVPAGTPMPPGIELVVGSNGQRTYYLQPLSTLSSRMVLRFGG
jgi:hypothetical protein